MNKNVFSSQQELTTNNAGGHAYKMSAKHALAQLAVTGTFNGTYYVDAKSQLEDVIKFANMCDPQFVMKVAIYARNSAYMKDMPAVLCAQLAARSKQDATAKDVLERNFHRIADNGKMVRNFVQAIRSGQFGRKSLGSMPKRLVERWFTDISDERLFRNSIGNDPSIADLIKMVHPRPATKSREALYAYLLGKNKTSYDFDSLPDVVAKYEWFKFCRKDGVVQDIPNVPFQMLTSLNLSEQDWVSIARSLSWHETRMNLNTLSRHGVFKHEGIDQLVAERLKDKEAIQRAKVFPYQLLVAYKNTTEVPHMVREALQDAMEIATNNVPAYDGKVYVCPDVSGSMSSPVTGNRGTASTTVRCIDVAALVTATILRNNKDATVIPFETRVVNIDLNPRDSVMTNADKLSRIGGGGTSCSAPLSKLNSEKATGDLVIYVSDNESWFDSSYPFYNPSGKTVFQSEWNAFKTRNPKAKLVCIDITPNTTAQVKQHKDVLQVGGWSDNVFTVISEFLKSNGQSDYWTSIIENINLD